MARQILTPRFTVRPCALGGYCVYDELTGQIAGEALFCTVSAAEQACLVANDVAVNVYFETLREMSDLKDEMEASQEEVDCGRF